MQMGQGFAASSIVLKQRPSSAIFLQLPRHDNSSKSRVRKDVRVRPPPPAPSESPESLDFTGFSGLSLFIPEDGACVSERVKNGRKSRFSGNPNPEKPCAARVSRPVEANQEANFIPGRESSQGFCWRKPPWSCSPDGCRCCWWCRCRCVPATPGCP